MIKNNKHLKVLLLILMSTTLSACATINQPINANSSGFWDGIILYNLSRLIIAISNLFAGNYAIGIIIFTVILHILLLPLNQMQMKSQQKMMEIQPELDAIKGKYPNRDRQSMELLQTEQQALLDEKGVNQFAGCLPLLIQLPILTALYQAILRTEVLRQGHFLWMNLGQRDPYFVLPLLAAGLAFWTTYLTTKANPQNNPMARSMTYFMPIMIFIISMSLPSAVALYLVVSNLVRLISILLFNNPYKIIEERKAEAAAKKAKEKELRKALKKVQKNRS